VPIERTSEGWELVLTPRGADRYATAGFLGFWLCGWAAGEAFALWFLIKGAIALLTGEPPDPGRDPIPWGPAVMVGLFLIVWLTLWTVGGIAAASEFVRLLWGRDRIVIASGRLRVTWSRWPFRAGREFERDTIRRILLVGRDDRLALESNRERVELSGLGTRNQRVEAAKAIRTELGIAEAPSTGTSVPSGWEVIITAEGERALVASLATRRAQARFMTVVTMVLATVTLLLGRKSVERLDLIVPALILLTFTIGAAAGATWLARVRWEWRIRSSHLTLRKRVGAVVNDVFEARRLVIDRDTDSDGDSWYALYAMADSEGPAVSKPVSWRQIPPKNSKTIARVMNDASTVHDLAAWLARETSLPLEDRTTSRAQEVQLAELRAALESSGRFGRWAARWVDRLDDKKKKAG
jgi:hypothetical protein